MFYKEQLHIWPKKQNVLVITYTAPLLNKGLSDSVHCQDSAQSLICNIHIFSHKKMEIISIKNYFFFSTHNTVNIILQKRIILIFISRLFLLLKITITDKLNLCYVINGVYYLRYRHVFQSLSYVLNSRLNNIWNIKVLYAGSLTEGFNFFTGYILKTLQAPSHR